MAADMATEARRNLPPYFLNDGGQAQGRTEDGADRDADSRLDRQDLEKLEGIQIHARKD